MFWLRNKKINFWYTPLTKGLGKCPKILNSFPLLFSNKMLVFRAGIHKMLIRIANREDPDQNASSGAV